MELRTLCMIMFLKIKKHKTCSATLLIFENTKTENMFGNAINVKFNFPYIPCQNTF